MIKKFIIKIHQILGSLLSLVFLVWFLSGIVMIFAGFPHVSKEKLFEKQLPLFSKDSIKDFPSGRFALAKNIELKKIGGTAFYLFDDAGKSIVLNAVSLKKKLDFSQKEVDLFVSDIYGKHEFSAKIINDYDQWIPWKHFSRYFPIKKYYIEDDANTVVYASLKTGDIVQETTRKSRWLARIGAIPHWFYFKFLRLNVKAWISTVVWISGLGSIMCFLGIFLGFYRLKRRRRDNKRGLLYSSPYKKRWYKWHHIVGFFFGITCFTFVFSGMMSLTDLPQWLVKTENKRDFRREWNSDIFSVSDYKLPVSKLIDSAGINIKRIKFENVQESPLYLAYADNYRKPLVYDASCNEVNTVVFKIEDIYSKIDSLFGSNVVSKEIIEKTDDYYGRREGAAFPVVKIMFNDYDKTWMYINPTTSKAVYTFNRTKRIRRYLYNGLHSLDFKCLAKHDRLRQILLVIFCLAGVVISYSGFVLSKRVFKSWFR